MQNKFSLPSPRCLPGGDQNIPFVLIGDDAFCLKRNMMKPYPQQNLKEEFITTDTVWEDAFRKICLVYNC